MRLARSGPITLSLMRWKVAPAFDSPYGILLNLERSRPGIANDVISRDSFGTHLAVGTHLPLRRHSLFASRSPYGLYCQLSAPLQQDSPIGLTTVQLPRQQASPAPAGASHPLISSRSDIAFAGLVVYFRHLFRARPTPYGRAGRPLVEVLCSRELLKASALPTLHQRDPLKNLSSCPWRRSWSVTDHLDLTWRHGLALVQHSFQIFPLTTSSPRDHALSRMHGRNWTRRSNQAPNLVLWVRPFWTRPTRTGGLHVPLRRANCYQHVWLPRQRLFGTYARIQ